MTLRTFADLLALYGARDAEHLNELLAPMGASLEPCSLNGPPLKSVWQVRLEDADRGVIVTRARRNGHTLRVLPESVQVYLHLDHGALSAGPRTSLAPHIAWLDDLWQTPSAPRLTRYSPRGPHARVLSFTVTEMAPVEAVRLRTRRTANEVAFPLSRFAWRDVLRAAHADADPRLHQLLAATGGLA